MPRRSRRRGQSEGDPLSATAASPWFRSRAAADERGDIVTRPSTVCGAGLLSMVWATAVFAQTPPASTDNELRLVEAVKQGDRAAINQLLERQVNVNVTAPDGATPLHFAAERADV